ncbi:MAG: putative OTU-like cysteine protease [Gammaproteobacteria bacterium]|nr:putative OTU-like cysteine protease [Gammaproteobacteria bacterium]
MPRFTVCPRCSTRYDADDDSGHGCAAERPTARAPIPPPPSLEQNNLTVFSAGSSLSSAKYLDKDILSPRKGLFNDNIQKHQIAKSMLDKHLSAHSLKIGEAIDNGDCFFDAVAQTLFEANKKTFNGESFTIASLRKICSEQAQRLENVNERRQGENWIQVAVDKDAQWGGQDYGYYRQHISKPFSEIRERGIWGRPLIEGKIFCQLLQIKLHIIQVSYNQKKNEYTLYHQLITDKGPKAVDEKEAYKESGAILRIAVYEGSIHFVPLFSRQGAVQNAGHVTSQYQDGLKNKGREVSNQFSSSPVRHSPPPNNQLVISPPSTLQNATIDLFTVGQSMWEKLYPFIVRDDVDGLIDFLNRHERRPIYDVDPVHHSNILHWASRNNSSDILHYFLTLPIEIIKEYVDLFIDQDKQNNIPLFLILKKNNFTLFELSINLLYQLGSRIEKIVEKLIDLYLAERVHKQLITHHKRIFLIYQTIIHFHPSLRSYSYEQFYAYYTPIVQMEALNEALLEATKIGDKNKLLDLLRRGALVNAKDKETGYTALHFASKKNDLDIAQILIAHKADVNAQRYDGISPLYLVAKNTGNLAMAQLLVQHGANITQLDKAGNHIISIARTCGHSQVAEFLEQKLTHRQTRTQKKFFNHARSKHSDTRWLTDCYLYFRTVPDAYKESLPANNIPARRLIMGDAGAVEKSLIGLDQKSLNPEAIAQHAHWYNAGLEKNNKMDHTWSHEHVHYELDIDQSSRIKVTEELTIKSQYLPTKGHIGNFRMKGIDKYGLGGTSYILHVINQTTKVDPESEKKLAHLFLAYARTGQPITTALLKNNNLVVFAHKRDRVQQLHYLNRVCYLTTVKEVSRRMHPGSREDGSSIEELPIGVAHAMALRLIADGHLSMKDVFDSNARFGLPTATNLSNERKIGLAKEKLNTLTTLFYSTYPDDGSSREAMHQLLLNTYAGASDTSGDEYKTSDEEN